MLSGDDFTVILGGPELPAITSLIGALGRIDVEMTGRRRSFTLIGGLAVVVRVATADRATVDIDTVVDVEPDAIATIELLAVDNVGLPAADGAPQRRIVEGVPVDFIDTYKISDLDLADLDDADALFVGSHRFACESTDRVMIVAGSRMVRVRVATPAALVATKLHAALYRRTPDKLGTDLFDLYRLLTACDITATVDQFAGRPRLLVLVRAGLARLFVDEVTRSAGRMAAAVAAAGGPVGDADLRAVGELFIDLTESS